MSLRKDGIIVVLSSPSGAGKTTLVKKIAQENNFKISISYTTRKPRTNEANGKDYFFISEEEFKNLIKKKQFLEHAKVFKNYYGSSKKLVLSKLKKGKNVIFDIDWQGTKQIKQKKLKYKLITFFILPPSRKILYQRLSRRDMRDKLIVEERMQQFDKDILKWRSYDFVVINDDLDLCYKQIIKLIKSKLLNTKVFYNRELIKNHIKFLKK